MVLIGGLPSYFAEENVGCGGVMCAVKTAWKGVPSWLLQQELLSCELQAIPAAGPLL